MMDSFVKKQFPFESKFFELPTLNAKIHYVSEGQGDPILCVHGNPTWSFYFRKIISEFRHSHQVIAFDHLGCGYSSRIKNFSYQLKDHIINLTKFVENLDLQNITLVVHDWGGAIALGFAVNNISRIKKIVLTNTASFYSSDVPKRIKILKTPIVGEYLIQKFNIFAQAATLMASAKGLSNTVKKSLLAPYNNYDSRLGIAKFIQDIPLNESHPTYKTLLEIEKLLPKLQVPVLALWGMKDFCFHEKFLTKWKNIYPHLKAFEVYDAGHYLFEDAPQYCLEKIKSFLDN
jgi:cis-3-alkyl-4-acyloxetan-2-one decarboxylase